MIYQDAPKESKKEFNNAVSHPLQSFEWGQFREKTGIKVVRRVVIKNEKIEKAYQLTIHPIPKTKYTIGYLPKGFLPDKDLTQDLKTVGRQENCIYIQIEPNVKMADVDFDSRSLNLSTSFHPLFTNFTFILDLTPTEEELLKKMHQKTRYNTRVAQKHEVRVKEDDSQKAFEDYLMLAHETTTRQGFYAHTKDYHKKMWDTLKNDSEESLSAHLLTAKYKNETLVAWILFVFKDTLYYPYGASSNKYREAMASNLMMWEAIKFGKAKGLLKFDMWGSLGPNADTKDPWYGFHRFKEGYGPTLTEFLGSFDLVLKPALYQGLKIADKGRWAYLRLRKLYNVKINFIFWVASLKRQI